METWDSFSHDAIEAWLRWRVCRGPNQPTRHTRAVRACRHLFFTYTFSLLAYEKILQTVLVNEIHHRYLNVKRIKNILLTKSFSVVCVAKSTVGSLVDGLVGSFQPDTVNTPHATIPQNTTHSEQRKVSYDDQGSHYVVLTDVFNLAVQTLVTH